MRPEDIESSLKLTLNLNLKSMKLKLINILQVIILLLAVSCKEESGGLNNDFDGFRHGWQNGRNLFGKFATATLEGAAVGIL